MELLKRSRIIHNYLFIFTITTEVQYFRYNSIKYIENLSRRHTLNSISPKFQVKQKLQKLLVLSPQDESCVRGWLEDKKYLSEKEKCIYISRLQYRWKHAKVVNFKLQIQTISMDTNKGSKQLPQTNSDFLITISLQPNVVDLIDVAN